MDLAGYVLTTKVEDVHILHFLEFSELKQWVPDYFRLLKTTEQEIDYAKHKETNVRKTFFRSAIPGDVALNHDDEWGYVATPLGSGKRISISNLNTAEQPDDLRHVVSPVARYRGVEFQADVTIKNVRPGTDIYATLDSTITKITRGTSVYQITAQNDTDPLPLNAVFVLSAPIQHQDSYLAFQQQPFNLRVLKRRFRRMEGIDETVLLDESNATVYLSHQYKRAGKGIDTIPGFLASRLRDDKQALLLTNELPDSREGKFFYRKAYETIEAAGGTPVNLDVSTLLRL